jgi:hypothetical protein
LPEVVIVGFFTALLDPFLSVDLFCVFRLNQCNSAPTLATTLAMVGNSSGSPGRSHYSSSCYDDRATRRFKAERDATRHELEIIFKEVEIAELEWEHQHKQLLEAIDNES